MILDSFPRGGRDEMELLDRAIIDVFGNEI